MRSTSRRTRRMLLATSLIVPATLGLLLAGGPNNIDFQSGFLRWNPLVPVPFTIDRGPLKVDSTGRILIDEGAGSSIVQDEMAKWSDIPTAALTLQYNGHLDQDITVGNYETFFGFNRPQGPLERTENPIIFDADGRIIDDFLGTGSSGQTLGFAGIRFIQGNEFLSGWAVLNGKQAATSGTAGITFRQTVLHELGHFIGLDHSQGLIENWNNPAAGHLDDIPVMFPYGGEPLLPADPIADDVAWLSWMYPEPGFAADTGTITGRVFRLRQDGPPLQGANVAAIPAIPDGQGGFTEARSNIVTCVSDFLAQGTGEFELPGLAPGYYYVRIDRISPGFTGGSGIGPFDERPDSFPSDYFDDQESASEDPSRKVVIHVGKGQTVSGIDLVANEPQALFTRLTVGAPAVRLASLGDDESKIILFPESFSFPFFGRIYREVYVNSDGNLTFLVGDALPGAPRTEDRFLTGPPRIAPFFTDLDPTQAFRYSGGVEVSAGTDFVRVRWIGVPEWLETGVGDPNTFGVLLYSSGDIVFEYSQSMGVTPDDDDIYGKLQAIAGISPGKAFVGSKVDLSSALEFDLGPSAIYQVFPGTTVGNAFDLKDRSIRFVAQLSELNFPFILGDSQLFTGIAVSNFGDAAATVGAELRGNNGTVQSYPGNPGNFEIEPDAQYAALAREIFGIPVGQSHAGWARLVSTQPEVGSFFQFANGLVGPLTKMDGGTAWTAQAQKLYFTRVYQGAQVYPSYAGLKSATTWLAIANPNDEAISVTLRLFNAQGAQVGLDVVRPVAGNGRVFETVATLFSLQSPVGDGFVEVLVDGPGAIGFEMIELDDALFGLNAATESGAQTLYSAQLGHSSSLFTILKVVNPTENAASVTLRAFIRQGNGTVSERVSGPFTLVRKQSFQQTVEAIFGLGPGGSQFIEGSIRVESSLPGIVGDVVFGDPQNARFAAALPLQSQPFRKAVFGQVSNGRVPGSPSLDSFTGLALFNPNAQSAEVTVEVFDKDGILIGDRTVTLQPNERISRLLYEQAWVPASLGLVRGFVVVTANRPIVAQQLFGNLALDYMSAVVPTIVE